MLEKKCGIKDAKEFQTLAPDRVNVYLRELWEFEEKEVKRELSKRTRSAETSSKPEYHRD